jgi:hypothetical protein
MLAAACGEEANINRVLPGGGGSCDPNTAQILIGDGYQQILCGCQEASGQAVPSGGGSVTCTVSAGKTIMFHYLGATLSHQIIPRDGSGLPASPVSKPGDETRIPTFGFRLDRAGNYAYLDAFDPGVSGVIVVH